MHLIYLDESGNSGNNLSDPQQPVFVLGALVVPEERWLSVETDIIEVLCNYFDNGIPLGFEIHATDLRNGTRHFRGVAASQRVALRNQLLEVANKHQLAFIYRAITKKRYATWLERQYGAGININPHIAAFPLVTQTINRYLKSLGPNQLGILINDENKEVVGDIERTTRLLRADPGKLQLDRIIEKSFFIDSAKSHVLQLSDLCTFHARKLEEVRIGLPEKTIDTDGIKLIEPLIHRGDEAMPDVLAWLTQQQQKP
ncbi:MAG: DUF3800 domain-containing protein [Verrucomicrobiales bacterium]